MKVYELMNALSIIESAPAADVRPERHGDWLKDDSDNPYWCVQIYCLECNYFNLVNIKSAYCPHCGTKMDGKGGEQNENHTIYAF